MMLKRRVIVLSLRGLHGGLILALILGAFLAPARTVRAVSFVVDDAGNAGDNIPGDGVCDTGGGVCTLRAAIDEANALVTNDDITFDPGLDGTPITSSGPSGENFNVSGDLDIANNGSLTITGRGPANTIINGGGADRVLDVLSAATVAVSDLRVTNGQIAGVDGAGIRNLGALTLTNVELTGNTATGLGAGGGLATESGGTTTMDASLITGNTAGVGGGVYATNGTVVIRRTLINNNNGAAIGGGGVYADSVSNFTIENSTLHQNTTVGDGGGIYVQGGTVNVNNVTISGNNAALNGSGVLANVSIRPRNTIIAGNAGGTDCNGFFNSQGYNVIENTTGCTIFGNTTGNLTGVNPLDPFNAGLGVYTLSTGSVAIDAGDPGFCPSPDQTNGARPNDGDGDAVAVCDMGAYEAPGVPVIPTNTPTPTNTPPPGATFTPTPIPTATPIVPTSPPPSGPQPTPAGVQPVGSGGGGFTCGEWRVTIPAGLVPDGGGLHCGPFDPDVAPLAPPGFRLLRHVINVNLYDNNGRWMTQLSRPITLCYPYQSADLSAAGNKTANFVVQTAPISGTWSVLTTTVNTSLRQACASAVHLTLFELSVKSAATGGTTYIVRTGDTLFSLALRFGTTVSALMAANGLISTWIYVGQILIIPGRLPVSPVPTVLPGGSNVYIVRSGDNLFRLGLRFGVSVRALQAANDLGTSIRIYVGQALIIPTRAPAPTPSPAPSTTPLPGGVTPYVVQPGDTLFRIALRFKTTVSALQVANHLSGIRIYAGQTLVIPSPVTPAPTPVVSRSPTPAAQNTYIVQSGDTLFRLALRFGTTVAALQAANHLSGTTIYVGQVLSIP